MIRTAEHLAKLPEGEHKHVTIRCALPDGKDVKFLDHLQKQFSDQVGFLPLKALEANVANGRVSIALENDEPAAYLLGKENYLRDPHFGIIYQAAVSYDARRRLMGTALVQHFIDHMPGGAEVRLIGLWCAQDIEANEFWNACGFEAIAARHGSRRKGRVHIFWVGRTPRGEAANEPMRYPKFTSGGLMREHREVFGLAPGTGSSYKEVVLPELADGGGERSAVRGQRSARRPRPKAESRKPRASLAEMQRAFRYGQGKHICVVIAGVTKYLPVAPFEMPNFTDLARSMVATASADYAKPSRPKGIIRARASGDLWTPAKQVDPPATDQPLADAA